MGVNLCFDPTDTGVANLYPLRKPVPRFQPVDLSPAQQNPVLSQLAEHQQLHINEFIEDSKASGLMNQIIETLTMQGVRVAPPGSLSK
ncbi:hypothetical protein SAMN05444170_6666 [Bradyrhizobium erythrophlei]|uniref:Uncharacterized protein n=1 Tax=Bradyrhizobium erythrophlei TaxID=1437360 RepID=A0A1M7UU21_9BRAD|nr:hypothetical protein [Bradyrhizobium erythrophlei]SHN86386.1 hypothetical protein SAMN05444170_6666 [Bradyrhizobium erythrophlei]